MVSLSLLFLKRENRSMFNTDSKELYFRLLEPTNIKNQVVRIRESQNYKYILISKTYMADLSSLC